MTTMAVPESSRLPYPKIHGDNEFMGKKEPEVLCYPIPAHLAQLQAPWQRINNHHTLSSARREAYHFDPSTIKDKLDFVLKSTYNHHKQLFKNREQVVVQPESCGRSGAGGSHVLKNRVVAEPEKTIPMNHPLIITGQWKQENIHSLKTGLSSNHVHGSRYGFSFKSPAGGFYLP